MSRNDRALTGAPASVARFQEAFSAPSRVAVLRELMREPMTFATLHAALGDTQARPTIYSALNGLLDMGYVTDDAPGQRKKKTTLFRAERALVLEDIAAVLVYVVG